MSTTTRFKRCDTSDDNMCIKLGKRAGLKLQVCHCYDSDNTHTFWEWSDVEIVDEDTVNYDIEERN